MVFEQYKFFDDFNYLIAANATVRFFTSTNYKKKIENQANDIKKYLYDVKKS